MLYEYASGAWTLVGRFIDGTTADNNAYLFGLEYDSTGLLHATWTVRETSNASTNHDLFYAYSRDDGRTWRNNAGTVVATTGSTPLISDSARPAGLVHRPEPRPDQPGVPGRRRGRDRARAGVAPARGGRVQCGLHRRPGERRAGALLAGQGVEGVAPDLHAVPGAVQPR
nr:hypothetical protein GCM10020092_041680 [Actinoplanes digitatis]